MKQKKTTLTSKVSHHDQAGQLVLEGVLIMIIFLGVAVAIKNKFNDNGYIGSLTAGPWASISKMMSDGTWDKTKSEGESHPLTQTLSREGDTN